MNRPAEATSENPASIYTLGKFIIRQGDLVISASSHRSKRMWELFKFILSNRNKTFFPEAILESIWPEREYRDPSTVMRAQMFRLRKSLNMGNHGESLSDNLVFAQGCYRWEDNIPCWIDTDIFEELVSKAHSLIDKTPDEAISLYQSAINLYKGEYLPETSFSEWVIAPRTYYHNLFLNAVFELADLLKERRAFGEIIKLCEHAAALDYYEDKIHIRLIEALLAEGMTTRARSHYNEVTSAYYQEMGVKPSDSMKSLYRLIGLESGSFELDLGTIQEGLKGKDVVKGAYLCDAELFKYFYKLERLRSERSGKSVLLCLMTLTRADFSMPRGDQLKDTMDNLQEAILDSLRKGDIACRWNEAQFLLLLPGLNKEQAITVMERTEKNFLKRNSLNGLKLHKKVETLLPLEGDLHFAH
ncbi:MAG: BTAD domain-containing putative transcriptional regulator [Bacillota bacterium]|nr:BTAD domain-containing putative transcriptional regulator [Bacillota bacterium]